IRADLAERFLGQPVERAKLIRETDSVLYVSGQKSFRIDNSGFLNYQDQTPNSKSSEDMVRTLDHALNFLMQKTGRSKELFIQQLTSYELHRSGSYSIEFSCIVNPYDVIPKNNNCKCYISMRIFDDHVTYPPYISRSGVPEEIKNEAPMELMPVAEGIEGNDE